MTYSLADMDGDPLATLHRVLLVGPEGGWTSTERSVDLPRVRIARHILRAYTAAITGCSILSALRDSIVSTS